jgi:hypothetical protein
MTVIPKISGAPRASMIRRAVVVEVVRSASPPMTAPACTVGIAFKNHARNLHRRGHSQSHHHDRNAPNGAAVETGRTCPVAMVAVPADG